MKLNTFWKGFIMALVGFVATTISEVDAFNLMYVAIATIGFTGVYLGKNTLFPSVSVIGFDLRDVLSGLIIAVGMALSSVAAQWLTIHQLDWPMVYKAVAGAVTGYFIKTIPSNAKK